jgi:sulfur carrier protein ThiS
MSAYIRVELHEKNRNDKPDADTYTSLHELLSQKKIERSVSVQDVGQQFLPSGFYYTNSSDKNKIGDDVNWAAKQLGYPYSYVVVINGGALVRNLETCTYD